MWWFTGSCKERVSLGECELEPADDACLSHAGDAVVFCGAHGAAPFSDGQLRLVSDSGAPVLPHDAGRLEMYLVQAQAWASVCRNGFTSGSAAVACKSTGFAGSSGFSSCATSGLCGAVAPHVADLACAGSESSVLQCPMAVTDDVFCPPDESVVLSCSGASPRSQWALPDLSRQIECQKECQKICQIECQKECQRKAR
eukprot:s1807_g13.t1